MDPAIILLWVQMITEFGAVAESLHAIGRRILAGENVTLAELRIKRTETDQAVEGLDAAVARLEAAAEQPENAPAKEDASADHSDVPGPPATG